MYKIVAHNGQNEEIGGVKFNKPVSLLAAKRRASKDFGYKVGPCGFVRVFDQNGDRVAAYSGATRGWI